MNKSISRISWIDGLRGIAALLVVFCHIACVFKYGLYSIKGANTSFEKIWLFTPLNVLTNGNTAVQFFFVISGFLITMNIYNKNISIKKVGGYSSLLNKFKKILYIVVPAIVLAYFLMKLNLYFHLDALLIDERLGFVSDYNNFNPNLINFLIDIVKSLFRGSQYVGPLWTIRYELLGSILIMLISNYAYQSKNKKSVYIYMGILLLFLDMNLISFIFGGFIYEIIYNWDTDNTRLNIFIKKMNNFAIIRYLVIIVAIFFATLSIDGCGIYSIIKIFKAFFPVLRALGISVLLFFLFKSNRIQQILSFKIFVHLGEISAYIYAFHWQIILSLGCFVFIKLYTMLNYNILIIVITVICLIAIIGGSFVYKKFLLSISIK
ncbi:acyltransferase family protein [Thomasclavelia cocleata]|uniref:acyltransferase family protein n=1 Tax=Thomasclavelia cocleata TaxID=69824 RepID=UPI002432688D|nr:acyltransferase [Thomasclavelia cocleata]